MRRDVIDRWKEGDESACPHCGAEHDYERREEDDGNDEDGHWVSWLWQCNRCGGEWYSTYYLKDPVIEEA
jgi:hypothetical protein